MYFKVESSNRSDNKQTFFSRYWNIYVSTIIWKMSSSWTESSKNVWNINLGIFRKHEAIIFLNNFVFPNNNVPKAALKQVQLWFLIAFLKIFRFKRWKIWKFAAWNSMSFGTLWAIRSNTTVLVCRRSFMSYYVKGFCVFPSHNAAQKIIKIFYFWIYYQP